MVGMLTMKGHFGGFFTLIGPDNSMLRICYVISGRGLLAQRQSLIKSIEGLLPLQPKASDTGLLAKYAASANV
jgi:hypothetical protein